MIQSSSSSFLLHGMAWHDRYGYGNGMGMGSIRLVLVLVLVHSSRDWSPSRAGEVTKVEEEGWRRLKGQSAVGRSQYSRQ